MVFEELKNALKCDNVLPSDGSVISSKYFSPWTERHHVRFADCRIRSWRQYLGLQKVPGLTSKLCNAYLQGN